MTGRITAWRWWGLRNNSSSTAAVSVSDYSNVLIPLDQAHLHSHSARCGRTEYEEVPGHDPEEDGEGEEDDPKDRHGDEGTGMLEMSAAEYSIEGLRKEVRKGGGGTRSNYESESGAIVGWDWNVESICGWLTAEQ